MNKKLIIPILIIGVAVVVLGVLILRRPKNIVETVKTTDTLTSDKNASGQIICKDNACFGNNFKTCTPAIYTMEGNDNGTLVSLAISVTGFKDSKCQYEMNMSGHGLRCQFSPDNLNDKVLNEMFGNDEGQAAVIAQSCIQF